MRVRLLIGILVLGFSFLAKAQEKIRFALDLGAQYNEVNQQIRVELIPGVSVQAGSHILKFAPIIQQYTTEARNNPEDYRLTGLSASYLWNCPTKRSYLDFFFVYEFKAQWFDDHWTGNIFDTDKGVYRDYGYKSEEFYTSNTLGYGFRINFGKHIYLQQSVSAGLRYSQIEGDPGYGPVPDNVVFDFRGYEDLGFHWNGSVSLGYRF